MRSRQPSRAATPLETKVIGAFRQAFRGHELEVAEHLLRALEVLAWEPSGQRQSCLSQAYPP